RRGRSRDRPTPRASSSVTGTGRIGDACGKRRSAGALREGAHPAGLGREAGGLPESGPVEAKSIYLPPNWRGSMRPAKGTRTALRCVAAAAIVFLGLTSLLS